MVGPHLVVLGLIAAGKSTVATAVAASLGRPHLDSDRQVEALTGRRGGEIAASEGVDHLHGLEEAVLLGALALDQPSVISAAAWVVESRTCREALARRATVVWLDLPIDLALARAATGVHRREIDRRELAELAHRRRPWFESVTDLRLDATAPVDELVVATLAVAPAAPS